MLGSQLHLLTLDGDVVCSLSLLIILELLIETIETIDPDSPPKVYDHFHMIGVPS